MHRTSKTNGGRRKKKTDQRSEDTCKFIAKKWDLVDLDGPFEWDERLALLNLGQLFLEAGAGLVLPLNKGAHDCDSI